jgi:cell division initiation protein
VEVSTEEFPRPLTAAGARAVSAYNGPPFPPDVRDEEIAMVLDAEFPIGLRGYDRAAVDAYVRRVSRVIAELEASRSPQSAIRYALEQVSEETRAILQQAHDSADAVTSKSRAEADDRLQRAEAESSALREAAEQRVRELEDDLAEIWTERERLLADVRDLSARLADVADAASERQPPAALMAEQDVTDALEMLNGPYDDEDPGEPAGPYLEAVPPPPEDAEPEPALADAPPPAAEAAAGPVALDDEPALGALDEPAAPAASEVERRPHFTAPQHEDDDRPEPAIPFELRDQGPDDDPDAPDDLDTAERERPR